MYYNIYSDGKTCWHGPAYSTKDKARATRGFYMNYPCIGVAKVKYDVR